MFSLAGWTLFQAGPARAVGNTSYEDFVMEEIASYKYGQELKEVGRMSEATSGLIDFDVSSKGVIFLGDGTNRRVHLLDPRGQPIRVIPLEGSGLSIGPVIAGEDTAFFVLLSSMTSDSAIEKTGVKVRKVDRQGRQVWEQQIPGSWLFHRYLPHEVHTARSKLILADWVGKDVLEIGTEGKLYPVKEWEKRGSPGIPLVGKGLFASYLQDSLGEVKGGTVVVKDKQGKVRNSWRPRAGGIFNGILGGRDGSIYLLYSFEPSPDQLLEEGNFEAGFRVGKYTPEGQQQAEVVLSLQNQDLRVVRVAVDGSGSIYELVLGPEGVSIIRWSPRVKPVGR